MKKIIEPLRKMPKRELKDCRITAFRDILLYHGVSIDSFTLFLLSNTMGFEYGLVKARKADNLVIWFAGYSHKQLSEELMDNLKIKRKKYQFPNTKEGLNEIIELIDKDIPIISLFDSRYINGGGSYKHLNIYSPSITLISGYDLEKRLMYLDLKNSDETEELFAMDLDVFMDSRNSICEPKSPDNICYTVDISEEYPKWIEENLKDLVRKCINKTCDSMLDKNEIINEKSDCFEALDYGEGIEGMRKLCQSMKDFKKEIKESNLSEDILNKIYIIKFLALREGMLQGSNTCFRYEFGMGIKNASVLLDCKKLYKIGDEFIDVAHKWRHLIRTLYVVKFHMDNKAKYLDYVVNQLTNILKIEEKLFTKIRKYINN